MQTYFSQVFWGLLIAFVDIRINGFDLLPDFIGYLIVAAGCGGLAREPLFITTAGEPILRSSDEFVAARRLCFVLALLPVGAFFVPRDLALVYGWVAAVIDWIMMWQLLGGVIVMADASGRQDLSLKAESRRWAYVALGLSSCALVSVMYAARLGSSLGFAVMIALGIVTVAIAVLILSLIHQAKHALSWRQVISFNDG